MAFGSCVLSAILLVCLGACGSEEVVPEARLSLLELFPFTESGQQLRALDLGAPAARPYLTAGWSESELAPSGESVVWASARKSQLRFSVPQPAARRLIFRSGVFPAGRRYPRRVTVKLNGRSVGRLRLQPGWQEVAVDLPAEAQWPGRNVLELVYSVVPRPARDGRHDFPRTLAFDWVRLELQDGTVEHGPMLAADGTEVILPGGSRSSYYVRVPSNASMTFRVRGAGRGDAVVRVSLERHRSPAQTLFTGGEGMARIDLSAYAGELARISFDVPGTDPVRVIQPCIVGAGRPRDEGDDETRLSEPPRGRPNVLLYVVDTLRADHLGCYGYRKPISPNIDAFAEDAVVFRAAIAQSPWTKPSVASLFTGVWPGRHRVIEDGQELPREAVTLAELLEPAGMERAAFVSNGHVSDRLGFDQGFDYFEWVRNEAGRLSPPAHSDTVNARVFRWLNERSSDVPFFLHVHTVDPHSPYAPPPEFYERFAAGVREPEAGSLENLKALRLHRRRPDPRLIADLVDLYDAEIAFNDASFGALVDELKRRDLYDDSLVIFLADHGEAFRDHDTWEHGKELYGEVLDVPLLIKFPARFGIEGGRRVDWLAQQVDVLPTVLETLGLPIPAGMEGIGLLGVLRAEGSASISRPGFAHLDKHGRRRTAVVEGAWKLIRIGSGPSSTFELYDRDRDPGERRNLFRTRPIVAGYLKALLALHERARGPTLDPATRVLDAETRENLRALGYVE